MPLFKLFRGHVCFNKVWYDWYDIPHTLSQCTLAGQCTLECHWLTHCTLGYHWATKRVLAGYTATPLEKLSWNCPTLECHWRSSDYCSLHWNNIGEQQAANGQISVNSAFSWGLLLLCNEYQFCFSNVWVLQHHSVHALVIRSIIIFGYLVLQFKWNQFSSNKSRHTIYMLTGLHAGKWPDLMTSKPDYVSTLGYHWTDCTGTSTADVITPWCPSGNIVLICIIGTHWKNTWATGAPGCH